MNVNQKMHELPGSFYSDFCIATVMDYMPRPTSHILMVLVLRDKTSETQLFKILSFHTIQN